MLDPNTIGAWAMTAILAAAAAFERHRGSQASKRADYAKERATDAEAKHSAAAEVLAAKDELIRLAREQADEWSKRFKAEHEEHRADREVCHERLNAAQQRENLHAMEVADLRAKTDVTKVLDVLKEIMASLTLVLQRLEGLEKKP